MIALEDLKLLIWILLVLCLTCLSSGFTPQVAYLLDCGSPTDTKVGNRTFVSDTKYVATSHDILASIRLNSITPFDNLQLYQTARIFTGPSSYKFSISQGGRIWIRLYFFPFSYDNYNMSSASFSVGTQKNVLLGNFSPKNATMKEFTVNVTTGNIVITFAPSNNSFAYVNALEVVSAPDSLITDDASSVNPPGAFTGLVSQALETVQRVNMGGPLVSYENDTLWRTWVPDADFLLAPNLATNKSLIGSVVCPQGGATEDIAPQTVYGTCTKMNSTDDPNNNFNVTWQFFVGPGFHYFLRMHFCDIMSNASNQILFNIYINSSNVQQDFEPSSRTFGGSLANALFVDFVTPVATSNRLLVSIGPSQMSAYPDAFLNGLEIMKLNNSMGSLSGVASVPYFNLGSKKNVGMIVGLIIGIPLVLLMVVFVFFMHKRKKGEHFGHLKAWIPISIIGGTSHTMGSKYSNGTTINTVSNLSYRVPFAVVSEATNNFDESWVIGIRGFGKVYKGVLNDGTKVAVKRGNPRSHQGLAEFRTEIEMLSQFRHRHLVSVIGYCDEKNEMILLYEYMENGTLTSHLYGTDLPSLSWKQRA